MQHEALLCIAAEHPCLPGHFPDQPLVPGVLILDRVVAAIREGQGDLVLTRLPQIKFLRPLLPAHAATLRLQNSDYATEVRVKFELHEQAQLIASGELRFRRQTADAAADEC